MRRAGAAAALRAIPAPLEPLVRRIGAVGERLGLGVHLVGGPVRDLLLGRPLFDVDLLVEDRSGRRREPALGLARAAAGSDVRSVPHARFGTVSVHGPHGVVDLASARREDYASPGALPRVRPGTLEEDLLRRDFSVNALAIPLNADAQAGRPALVDRVDGRRDLEARRLRVLHDRSFHDDPTRALRGARFAARLGFRLEPGSRRSLAAACDAGAFAAVSGERYRAELARAFGDREADPGRTLALLAGWGVLAALLPGLGGGARAPLRRLGSLLAKPPPDTAPEPLVAGLMTWLAFEAPRRRRALVGRLALTGRPAARVLAYPALARRLGRALARPATRGADDARLRGLPAEELVALAASLSAAARRRILRHAHEDRALVLPVDGADLVGLGLVGPAVGRALARLRRAALDGRIHGREEALAFLCGSGG